MPFPSALFKAKARQVLRNHWQTALLIALAVNLPSLLVQAVSSFAGTDPLMRLESLMVAAARDGQLTQQYLADSLQALLQDSGVVISLCCMVLAWLVTPCLALGMTRWLLMRLRGEEGPFGTVFSRLNVSHKAIGLRLLITLKVILWMLPGAALLFGGAWVLAGTVSGNASSAMTGVTALSWAGMIAMAVPAVMAALRYALADILLADEPGKAVTACIRESKQMMNRRKGMLFSLELSFIFWYLGEMLVSSFLAGLGSGVLSLMFQMLAGLFLSVYMEASVCAFSEAVRKLPVASADTPTPGPEEEEPLN